MSLEDLRRQIDSLDSEMLALLSRRATLAHEVGRGKVREDNGPFYRPERERQIFDRLTRENAGPLTDDAIRAIFREVISASRALEAPTTVAYLGPPGTFSHRAVLSRFGASSVPKPVDTIPDVFTEVERGAVQYGVVPLENSTEGVVREALDAFARTKLKVCAEVFVPVQHHLASRAASLGEMRRLYAHPQSLAQSRLWIRENLPRAEIVTAASNSKSAQMAAVDSESAAICTDIAADIHGLPVVAQHIEDSVHNRTRFVVIGQNQPQPTGRDKTSIYFSVRHKAGALLQAMTAFRDNQINLTMIESRPTKQMPWEYVFFMDFQGHVQDEPVARALQALEEQSLFVTVLGSYPEAEV